MVRRTQQASAGAAILASMSLILTTTSAALAVAPTDGGSLDLTVYPISVNSAVWSLDPHVSGDLVSYSADQAVHYYDFFTGSDNEVPGAGPGSEDFLSDVSGQRIIFNRWYGKIMVFDTTDGTLTEFDPLYESQRFGGAIGSDTVAFFDQVSGAMFAGHLGGPAFELVDPAGRIGQHDGASVAPQGDLVVYELCPPQDVLDCDIEQAVWTGSSWVVTNLTSSAAPEANADTDGTIVVYEANRGGTREIAWQPVGGGAEKVLELPGEQGNPSVSAGVISFESTPAFGTPADMYVYEIASNRLFRITTTPEDDVLNDISKGADGRFRLVWTEYAGGNPDVYGATFEIPPLGPTYTFGGFLQPVDALPTLNSMKAGAAVPVKFSLGGNQGLAIFATGYPKSQVIACDSSAQVDGVELTVSAGGSALTYDPLADTYSYVWKTDKAWVGTCRQLVIGLADGTFARANFKLK